MRWLRPYSAALPAQDFVVHFMASMAKLSRRAASIHRASEGYGFVDDLNRLGPLTSFTETLKLCSKVTGRSLKRLERFVSSLTTLS